MQAITNDLYIKNFLGEINPSQHLITLKQLIYIGIKVVNNSLANPQHLSAQIQSHNKENQKKRINNTKICICQPYYKCNKKKPKNNLNNQIKTHLHKAKHSSSQGKIESSLLREISKIRTQLQSLTNKVYDHCFEEEDCCSCQSSMSLNNEDQVQRAHGFYPRNAPTFSANQAQSLLAKPFQKQANNFFVNGNVLNAQNQNVRTSKIHQYPDQNRQKRVLSRHHLDDTQIKKALYSQNVQQNQNESRLKAKSMIEKKEPVRFFQELDQKQTKQIKRSKKSRRIQHFDNNCVKTVKAVYKNVQSKIKPLVQRDRLRYQENARKEKFSKGFNKYQNSENNEFDEDDDFQDYLEEQSHGNHQQEGDQFKRSSEREAQFSQNKSHQKFQFYGSNEGKQKKSNTFKQDFIQREQEKQESDNVNIGDNSSSFSQFSINESSKREVGKISRRAPYS